MIQVILLIFILLLPSYSEAAYKVYLKDGSVVSGVGFYEKKGSEVGLYFKDGLVWVSEKDILKIEGTASAGDYFIPDEVQVTTENANVTSSRELSPDKSDKITKVKALRDDVDALNEEIRSVNLEEVKLVTLINEKRNEKTIWNQYQMMQLENELKPLTEELRTVQQRKVELIKRKDALEKEISKLTMK